MQTDINGFIQLFEIIGFECNRNKPGKPSLFVPQRPGKAETPCIAELTFEGF